MTNLQIYLFSLAAIFTLFFSIYFQAGFKKPVEAAFDLILALFFYSIPVLLMMYPLHSQVAVNITGVVTVIIAVAIQMFRKYFVKRAERKVKK